MKAHFFFIFLQAKKKAKQKERKGPEKTTTREGAMKTWRAVILLVVQVVLKMFRNKHVHLKFSYLLCVM